MDEVVKETYEVPGFPCRLPQFRVSGSQVVIALTGPVTEMALGIFSYIVADSRFLLFLMDLVFAIRKHLPLASNGMVGHEYLLRATGA